MRVLDLFSGIGGFSLGLERAGFQTVAFCEIEPYPQKVLAKHWPGVKIYDDVRTLTAERLAGDGITGIDVITGGFPCQDLSVAGKQAGMGEGTRSGLWSEIARLIGELQPRYAIIENVTALLSGGGVEHYPYNRCVCGWPYRWGGVHIHHAQQEGEHLHSTGRYRDDNKSGADIPGIADDWRECAGNQEGHKTMGSGEMLVNDRRGSDKIDGANIPASDFEEEASRILSRIKTDAGLIGEAPQWHGEMDEQGEKCRAADEAGNIDSEPEGAGCSGGGQDCESCGRPVVYESGRLRKSTWFGRVLGDLAALGYDAEWHCIPASELGAHHHRDRVWVIAYPYSGGLQIDANERCACDAPSIDTQARNTALGSHAQGAPAHTLLADSISRGRQGSREYEPTEHPAKGCIGEAIKSLNGGFGNQWRTEPRMGRVANGIPHRTHRLKGLGNAVVPQIPELIGRAIMEYEANRSDNNGKETL
jgi:site-specific DNA-cytosine methylase